MSDSTAAALTLAGDGPFGTSAPLENRMPVCASLMRALYSDGRHIERTEVTR